METGDLACPNRAQLGRSPRSKPLPIRSRVTFVPPNRAYTPPAGTTIHSVKAYRIERIKGGMKFTCSHCAHSVSTLDFDARTGNLRTQAATAINDHAAKAHHEPLVVPPSDGQQRTWR